MFWLKKLESIIFGILVRFGKVRIGKIDMISSENFVHILNFLSSTLRAAKMYKFEEFMRLPRKVNHYLLLNLF